MTKHVLTKTRFRRAPLAASIALLWSSATLAVPGEPVLDWIEPEHVLGESNPSADIKVSWDRFYGDPALTARYLLNDELVLTRAADAGDAEFEGGEQSGSATLSIDRAGAYEIIVELCNAEGCIDSEPVLIDVWDSSADSAVDPMPLTGAQAEALSSEETQRRFAEIEAILAPYATDDDLAQWSADGSWGSWLAGFVGQSVLKYGIGMGLDELVNVLGLGNRGPDLGQQLSDIQQSLDEMRRDLAGLAQQIDANHAEGLFHTTNSSVLTAMSNIRTVSRAIAGMEERGIDLTDAELGNLAYANSEAADLLQTHADGGRGAVALMLDYYQLKYPVSSGIEVRQVVDDYVDGVRAAFGAAVLNQVWLREARPANQVYDDVEDLARAAVDATFAKVGAPYPQLPSGPSGFVHRLGSNWALVDATRPTVGGARPMMTQNRNEILEMYGAIGVGVNAPGEVSIAQYMDAQRIKNLYLDPTSTRVTAEGGTFMGFWCDFRVRADDIKISGNVRTQGTHTLWGPVRSHGTGCNARSNKKRDQANDAMHSHRSRLYGTEKVFKVAVTTNDWGMPALMDDRSIESHRDGIYIDAIDRGQGNSVTVTYDKNGYEWLQVRNPQTGTIHYTGPNSAQTLTVGQAIAGGALELVQGHRIENREGEESILAKERTVVFENPNTTGMTVTLQPS